MITIIGSGLAGITLVREIRKLDAAIKIRIITQDNGDYYSKPRLSTAFSHQKTADQLVLMSARQCAEQFNIDLESHTLVTSLDNIVKKEDKLVLALGAKPAIPPVLSRFPQKIYQVNHLQDYRIFREALEKNPAKSVTIIGAGLVGCEFAHDLQQGGYTVTLIAPEAYPLARLVPEAIGTELHRALALLGVQCNFDQFFDAGHPENYAGTTLLSATGLKPEIALAKSHGIFTHTGIVVDDTLRTNHENIYALGDCVEFQGKIMPYVGPIAVGARALAKSLLGEATPVVYPVFPVFVKTPCYPIVSLLPDSNTIGEWRIEKEKNRGQSFESVRALFYNIESELKGFALGGSFASEANQWTNLIVP